VVDDVRRQLPSGRQQASDEQGSLQPGHGFGTQEVSPGPIHPPQISTHEAWVRIWHVPSKEQQAPAGGQGLGAHSATGMKVPPWLSHSGGEVMTTQLPFGKQQAKWPGLQGFGSQVVKSPWYEPPCCWQSYSEMTWQSP
jgi:hypothetical protein